MASPSSCAYSRWSISPCTMLERHRPALQALHHHQRRQSQRVSGRRVARAARDVLLATLPTRADAVNTAYAHHRGPAGVSACTSQFVSAGETIGAEAAAAILALRRFDGSATPMCPTPLPRHGRLPATLPVPAPPRRTAVRRMGPGHAVRARQRGAVSTRRQPVPEPSRQGVTHVTTTR